MADSVARQLDRLRHHARRPLARTPYLWDAAMYVRAGKRATLARPDTDIVIEGFLRSGNTFSVAAFIVANGREGHIGRHLHGAPHILRAVRLGLPTVVLARDPRDAVPSYLIRRPTLTPDDALKEYVDFYRTSWRARSGFVVGLFEQVVSDFGVVIEQANHKFGTRFAPYRPTPENEAATIQLVEEMNRLECRGEIVETHVGRPSAERVGRKEQTSALLNRDAKATLLAAADALYQDYVSYAKAQAAE
jgi:hypothetical protein